MESATLGSVTTLCLAALRCPRTMVSILRLVFTGKLRGSIPATVIRYSVSLSPHHRHPYTSTGRLRGWRVANCNEVVQEHLLSLGDKLARLRLAAEGHGDDPSDA
ncbi:hypothetical protein MAPG_10530 [Magnaporthiopsis poae ATCC 64411]|uniref:Uncharacterized protein n=1 Tax=Magnaporthiopsis poae (strain ATCC 64411 / 73-15) TaxID=644358 RepID=A0A0C4ECU5_MAGP6|nr:hypothetical protein MAPG_10530 [Magnaporthiopsis poae ATCC 64411]